jgi:hypothetical protein
MSALLQIVEDSNTFAIGEIVARAERTQNIEIKSMMNRNE